MKNTFYSLLVLLAACSAPEKKTEETVQEVQKPIIAATSYPLAYFAEVIGGDLVEVNFPVSPDVDPAFFFPDDAQLSQFQAADVILINGSGYEDWTNKVSLQARKMVNTSAAFENQLIRYQGVAHTHGSEGAHSHEEIAFTTWLDFNQAITQASAIRDKLAEMMPDQREQIQKNHDQLATSLKQLDSRAKDLFTSSGISTLYGSHPVYQYFGRACNVEIISKHWEPDQEISHHDWHHFEDDIRPAHTRIMLWEGEPIQKTREQMEAASFQLAVFAPCGNRPDTGDFMSMMNQNLDNLAMAIEKLGQ